ncbi:hypothetical protein [Taylorella equigenitalis]|uniref:hypothetical protein n=1 Tax=Taylorella equigenitalis TaxID=29575 RepID=UPI00237DD56E|nr:hypothetical protein [Taylorella equigenitalis]WDU51974.1 hypothetical protein KNO32_00540 [Taylorella equigenitalis]
MDTSLTYLIVGICKIWPVTITAIILVIIVDVIAFKFGKFGLSCLIFSILFPILSTVYVFAQGSWITVPLIYKIGLPSQGRIINSSKSGIIFNEQYVDRIFVEYKTMEGNLIQTSVLESAFNVYPKKNYVRYPQEGKPFNLRYLPKYPSIFVFISD